MSGVGLGRVIFFTISRIGSGRVRLGQEVSKSRGLGRSGVSKRFGKLAGRVGS